MLLGFMGIDDVEVVHAEKIGFGPEARALAIEAGREAITVLVARERVAA